MGNPAIGRRNHTRVSSLGIVAIKVRIFRTFVYVIWHLDSEHSCWGNFRGDDCSAIGIPSCCERILDKPAIHIPARKSMKRMDAVISGISPGTRGISGEFLLTMNLFYPDQEKIRERTEARRQWTVNQATGPMMRFLPQLAIRKKGFDVLFSAVNGGDVIVRASFTLLLIAGSADEASRRCEEARTYLREIGFEMMTASSCSPCSSTPLPVRRRPRRGAGALPL